MRLLLDTHALLWWWADDPRLSDAARAAIADEANEVLVSAVSAWEIATKQRLGKLPAMPAMTAKGGDFTALVAAEGFENLPVTPAHAWRAGAWAVDHRDPFDRMLAAQSDLEGLALVTRDPAFAAFDTTRLW